MRSFPRNQSKTTGLLTLTCLGLLGVIYTGLDEPPLPRPAQSMPSGTALTPVAYQPEIEVDFAMPPFWAYLEIGARPLFTPNRRLALAGEATPAPGEPPTRADRLMLRGIATAGDHRVALVELESTNQLLRLLEGQTVDGWWVAAIMPRNVMLEAGSESYILELEKDQGPVFFEPHREELVDEELDHEDEFEADEFDAEFDAELEDWDPVEGDPSTWTPTG